MGITKCIHKFEAASLRTARFNYAKLRLCEVGNQYFVNPGEDVQSAEQVYSSWGVSHVSIDLNPEDGALPIDLTRPAPSNVTGKFDVVTNYGTLEHVNNQFQAFENMHELCGVGGLMLHSLPPPDHWPRHGRNYYPLGLVTELGKTCNYAIINLTQRNIYGDYTRFTNRDICENS